MLILTTAGRVGDVELVDKYAGVEQWEAEEDRVLEGGVDVVGDARVPYGGIGEGGGEARQGRHTANPRRFRFLRNLPATAYLLSRRRRDFQCMGQ